MEERERYIDKLEKRLREWNEQIDEFQKKANNRSQEVKATVAKRMKELRVKRTELQGKLDRIKDSGEETFENIRDDTEKLWKDIKEGFRDLRSKI